MVKQADTRGCKFARIQFSSLDNFDKKQQCRVTVTSIPIAEVVGSSPTCRTGGSSSAGKNVAHRKYRARFSLLFIPLSGAGKEFPAPVLFSSAGGA